MTNWQGENDFTLFKSSVPISSQQVWQAFYDLNKEQIKVQKEKVAVEKLKIIIKATFKLANEKGFSLMSLRDLSQSTDMSMGSLYTYIGSKGQLAEMIHQFLPHIFKLCISDQFCESDSVKQQLNKLVRGHVFVSECLQPWFFFTFMETKHLSRSIKQLAKDNELKSEVILEEIILKGEQQGLFFKRNKFLTSMMIKALLQNWYVKHGKYKHNKVDCESYINFIDPIIKQYLESSDEAKTEK